MPQLAIPVVAGAVAFGAAEAAGVTIAAGALTYAAIGFSIGSIAATLLFPTVNNTHTEGARIGDLTIQSSSYGVPIPIVYGKARIAGNIIWALPIRETINNSDGSGGGGKGKSGGGKGGGASSTTYTYSASFALMLCEGPIAKVLRIWADNNLVYDATGGSDTINKIGFNFRFYPGSTTQMPDPAIEANRGAGRTSAYRGRCYLVFDDIPLTDYGNRVPNFQVEITTASISQTLEHDLIELPVSIFPQPPSLYNPYDLAVAINPIDLTGYVVRNAALYPAGLVKFDLSSMVVQKEAAFSSVFTTPGIVTGFVTIGPDQALYCQTSAYSGASALIVRIDPNTLAQTASFPASTTPYVPNTPTQFGAAGGFGALMAVGGGNFLVCIGLTGNTIGVLACPDLTYAWGAGQTTSQRVNSFSTGHVAIGAGDCYLGCHDDGTVGGAPMSATFDLQRLDVTVDALGGASIILATVASYTADQIEPGATGWANGTLNAPRNGSVVMFDHSSDSVLIGMVTSSDTQYLVKVDAQTGAILWKTVVASLPEPATGLYQGMNNSMSLISGSYAVQNEMIDTNTGAITQTSMPPLPRQYAFESTLGVLVGSNKLTVQKILLARVTATPISLQTIFNDVSSRAGFVPADIVTDALTDVVFGFTISQRSNAADILRPLAQVYQIDAVERSGKMVFQHRGGATVADVVQNELIQTNANAEPYEEVRVQEIDLPVRTSLTYIDVNTDDQPGTQIARRVRAPDPTVFSDSSVDLTIALAMGSDEAKQHAETLLYGAWISRHTFSMRLPLKYLWIDPADPVNLTLNTGYTLRARLGQVDVGNDFSLDVKLIAETDGQYVSTVQATTGISQSRPVSNPGPTKLVLLDVPLLRDVDELGASQMRGYYTAGSFGNTAWPGTIVQESPDATTWTAMSTDGQPMAYGYLVTPPLNPDSVFRTQRDGSFVITMVRGEDALATVTDLALANGSNAAAFIKPNGEVEILQFRDVVPLGGKQYRCSRLLRGRRNTDTMVGGHAGGETVVLLTLSTVVPLTFAETERNTSRYWRGLTIGLFAPLSVTQAFTFHGRDKMPAAPVHVRATASGGDVLLSWVRRTRLNGRLMPGTGTVPLSEASEAYEVDILSAPGGTVVRTIAGLTTPAATYTGAQMTTDFGGPQSVLTLRAYQISAVVGRGFSREDTVRVA